VGKSKIWASLWEKPKDVGYRFGFISILLIVITATFPVFVNIGGLDPQIIAFQGLFLTGLLGSMFFSHLLAKSAQTRRDTRDMFSIQNINKQMAVLMIGVVAGLVMVVLNVFLYGSSGGNVLLSSVWGEIDAKVFYLGMLAGVAEELYFRGFLGTFLRLVSPSLLLSVVSTAVIFSLFHWFAYSTDIAFVILFVLGLILGFIHEFTNDIGAPMMAHVINNSFAMLPAVLLVVTANLWLVFAVAVLILVFRVTKTLGRTGKIGGIKIA